MQIALMVEGQTGLTWDRWRALVEHIEQWGFAGLYRSDHFTMSAPPNENALELIVSLTYLAANSRHIHFGPLVAPFSFRDPVMLARQAAHIDALTALPSSNPADPRPNGRGRMVLGVGAGWQEREHEMFGYALLDKRARMERFAEGLHIVHALLKGDAPVTFDGRWYNLRDAEILPRPFKTTILVGGNGAGKTLPLAAKYADVWNAVGIGPERFQELAALLDTYLYDAGRRVDELKKTAATFLYFGRTREALEQRVARHRNRFPEWQTMPLDQLLGELRHTNNSITGLADEVIPQIRAYADAGVQELMLQILDSDDIDGLNAFAEQVMPHVIDSGQRK